MKAKILIEYTTENYNRAHAALNLLEDASYNYDATFKGDKNKIRTVKGQPLQEIK